MSVAPDQVTYSQLPAGGGVVAKENKEFALAVGARLRLLEKALGLSGTEICRELGIPDANWSAYKMGDNLLRPHIAMELKQRYGCALDWLYVGDETHNAPPFQAALVAARRQQAAHERERAKPRPVRRA